MIIPCNAAGNAVFDPRSIISGFIHTVVRHAVLAGVAALCVAVTPRAGSAQTLPAPVLAPFDGRWHTDTYPLRGEIDTARFLSIVRILRNGVVIDSVSTSASKTFSVTVPLLKGTNVLTAVVHAPVVVAPEDTVLVTSPPSNAVTVEFDTGAGMFIPVPMTPGRSFDLNAVNPASGAALRVFDMAGELVMIFESTDSRTFYSFPWDGLNASRERVRRGPLIAVGTIDYPGGEHEVIRRAFLFDPESSP